MPKGPQGQKRPADVIGNAIKVSRIAVGEETDDVADELAQANGGGVLAVVRGGKARSEALSKKRRAEIARNAAAKRWGKDR